MQVPGLESGQILHFNLPKASLHISQAGLFGPLTDSIANLLMKNWRAWRLKISCLSRHIRKLPGSGGGTIKKVTRVIQQGLDRRHCLRPTHDFIWRPAPLLGIFPLHSGHPGMGRKTAGKPLFQQSTLGLTSPSVNVRKCSGILLAFYF